MHVKIRSGRFDSVLNLHMTECKKKTLDNIFCQLFDCGSINLKPISEAMATFDKAINFLSCSLSCLSAYFLSGIQDLFEYVHFQNQVDTSNQCLDIEWFEESY